MKALNVYFKKLLEEFLTWPMLVAVESRRRREDDVMAPMMGEGMNSEVGPPHPGMMNKKQFPPGEENVCLSSVVFACFQVHDTKIFVFFSLFAAFSNLK